MNIRESLGPLAVALLCILALGLAAATLTSPVDSGDGPGSGPGESGEGDQEIDGSIEGRAVASEDMSAKQMLIGDDPTKGVCVEQVDQLPMWPFVFGVAGLVATLVLGRYGQLMAVSSFILTVLPLVLVILLLTGGCVESLPLEGVPENFAEENKTVGSAGEEGGGDEDSREDDTTLPVTVPTILVAFFVLATTVILGIALFSMRSKPEDPVEEVEAPDATDPTMAVGAVAGEAADEIEAGGSDLENEVYRAWAQMAAALEVDHPDTSTPAEFAEAASEAGIRPDDVRELTALFEEVRYGTVDATSDRERQAIDALRRIERSYTDDPPGESDEDSGGQTTDADDEGGA